jgi:hypothetical protein
MKNWIRDRLKEKDDVEGVFSDLLTGDGSFKGLLCC